MILIAVGLIWVMEKWWSEDKKPETASVPFFSVLHMWKDPECQPCWHRNWSCTFTPFLQLLVLSVCFLLDLWQWFHAVTPNLKWMVKYFVFTLAFPPLFWNVIKCNATKFKCKGWLILCCNFPKFDKNYQKINSRICVDLNIVSFKRQ